MTTNPEAQLESTEALLESMEALLESMEAQLESRKEAAMKRVARLASFKEKIVKKREAWKAKEAKLQQQLAKEIDRATRLEALLKEKENEVAELKANKRKSDVVEKERMKKAKEAEKELTQG